MGLARTLVKELGPIAPLGTGAARLLMLGYPLGYSMKEMAEKGSDEVATLASLAVSAPRSSASLAGRGGEVLSLTLERWVKARENRRMEQRVLTFRSLVSSGVMGAVTAMVASLGPLLASLSFAPASPSGTAALLPAAACMTAVSSAMLGLFMSGRRFVVNLAVSLAVFAVVAAAAAPLASAPSLGLWGVK